MKVYRTKNGYWINLSLCTRFYIEKNEKNWNIIAAIDYAKNEYDDEVILYLSDDHNTKEEAQEKLDSILQFVAHDC